MKKDTILLICFAIVFFALFFSFLNFSPLLIQKIYGKDVVCSLTNIYYFECFNTTNEAPENWSTNWPATLIILFFELLFIVTIVIISLWIYLVRIRKKK